MESFKKQIIAHRGLFDNNTDAPENSIKAFKKAVNKKLGIEFDVQITADQKLVVFHDDSLKRVCSVDKLITDCSFEELKNLFLFDSKEKIPLFSDVLNVIDGKVPIIIEIKDKINWIRISRLVSSFLDNYEGEYCIESFSPLVIRWFRKHKPNVIRGQLSTNYFKEFGNKLPMPKILKFCLTNLLFNFLSRPDFIAYNHLYKNHWSYLICKIFFNPVNVAWTIKSVKDLENARGVYDIFICENK